MLASRREFRCSGRTAGGTCRHLRNVCCEMVENQIDSTIPRPKVTARKKENEDKARLIENMAPEQA